jgi:hypothetical protein
VRAGSTPAVTQLLRFNSRTLAAASELIWAPAQRLGTSSAQRSDNKLCRVQLGTQVQTH